MTNQKVGLTFSVHRNDALVRRETSWQDIVKVGRDARAHLRLDDELVARVHAVIEVASSDDITLIDLGSESGTLVNGARVSKCKLRPGDELQVGMTRIVLESVEPWATAAVATLSSEAAPPGQELLQTMILDRYPGFPAASDPAWDRMDALFRPLRGLRALGYWAPGSSPDLPHPQHFVDPSWDSNERDAVFAYLHLGEMILPWKGYSWCRFDCGLVEQGFAPITDEDIQQLFTDEGEQPAKAPSRVIAAPMPLAELVRELRAEPDTLGAVCVSDGHFIWPEGLAHYVDRHFVRPPEEFVQHALRELSRRGVEKCLARGGDFIR